MNLPSGLWGVLGVDYILAFLSVGWITFLHSGLCLWGGLGVDYMDCILVYGWIIFILKNLLWKNKSQFHQLNYAIWVD